MRNEKDYRKPTIKEQRMINEAKARLRNGRMNYNEFTDIIDQIFAKMERRKNGQ